MKYVKQNNRSIIIAVDTAGYELVFCVDGLEAYAVTRMNYTIDELTNWLIDNKAPTEC
jgi:hypothetical protein